jgi:hypothetical protein
MTVEGKARHLWRVFSFQRLVTDMSVTGESGFLMRAVELFCGAGGTSLGLKRAGFELVQAYDAYSTKSDHACGVDGGAETEPAAKDCDLDNETGRINDAPDEEGGNQVDFKALFQQQQKLLALELEIARERFKHYGLRGNAVEISVRDFLERHLPRSLNAGTGEVVASLSDTEQKSSGQIDVVISNQLQPFIGPRDTPTTFLLEGVHMAGEVKTSLSRSMIQDELVKARKFRALRAQNVSRLVGVPEPDNWLSYYVFYRPYFLLGLETSGNWRAILLEVMTYIDEHRKMPLDGIFMLDQDVVIILSPYLEYPMVRNAGIPFEHVVDGKKTIGSIHIFKTTLPLAFFMCWVATFRGSFFDDRHPIAFYLQEMLNEDLPAEIVISENLENLQEFSRHSEATGPFKPLLDQLRQDFPLRTSRLSDETSPFTER